MRVYPRVGHLLRGVPESADGVSEHYPLAATLQPKFKQMTKRDKRRVGATEESRVQERRGRFQIAFSNWARVLQEQGDQKSVRQMVEREKGQQTRRQRATEEAGRRWNVGID